MRRSFFTRQARQAVTHRQADSRGYFKISPRYKVLSLLVKFEYTLCNYVLMKSYVNTFLICQVYIVVTLTEIGITLTESGVTLTECGVTLTAPGE